MLGNNADAFFTSPMKTSIVSGNSRNALAGMMPAPYESGASATKTIKEFSMLPGVGGVMLPGVGDEQQDPAQFAGMGAEPTKVLGMTIPVLAGVAAVAFLMFTPPGRRLRAKFGF